MKTLSIVISVYKKVRELEILLTALSKQTYRNFDVLIADDGSGDFVHDFVTEYSRKCDYKIIFLTQVDNGFRKNRILNEAIRTTESDYMIFLDCDCIPHKDFVMAHIQNSEASTVLVGRRVHLNKGLSELLSREYILSESFDSLNIKALANSFKFKKATSTAEEGIIVKSKLLRKIFGTGNNHIVGCNFSVPKELLLRINGFDENYIGAGIGEDTDIEYRLRLINAKFKSVRNLAVVFHMYHTKTKEDNSNYNYFHFNVKTKNVFYCENGIFKPEKYIQG